MHWARLHGTRAGPLVGARPVRDGGETSDRTMLHHEVEILGEALDDGVALRETGAALEPDLKPGLVQRPHAVGDSVVLLDERRSDPRRLRHEVEQLRKVAIVVDEA